MEQNLSLSPAQIQYLKIGPKVGTSNLTTKQLQDSLTKFDVNGNDATTSLSGIPKFSYGNFEQTVNNFGVLLHRNFVGTSTLHQAQKFGKVAKTIDSVMQQEKDKPVDNRHPGQKRSFIDSRTRLKAIHEHRGNRLLLTLSSFMIEQTSTKKIAQTLPLAYIKLMLNHVSSSKLAKSIEGSMRSQGSMVIIDFQKMESKVSGYQNNEDKYDNGPFLFQRSGHEFNIITPLLEIFHSESEYKRSFKIDNRDILDILQSDFDNVDQVVDKYVDFIEFQEHLVKCKSESNRSAVTPPTEKQVQKSPTPVEKPSTPVEVEKTEAPVQKEEQTPRPATPLESKQVQKPSTPAEQQEETPRPPTPQQKESQKPSTPAEKQQQTPRPPTPQESKEAQKPSTPKIEEQTPRPATPKVQEETPRPATPKAEQPQNNPYTPGEPEAKQEQKPQEKKQEQ